MVTIVNMLNSFVRMMSGIVIVLFIALSIVGCFGPTIAAGQVESRQSKEKTEEMRTGKQAKAIRGVKTAAPKAANSEQTQAAGGGKQLKGLRQKPAWMTHVGCLLGCTEYLKINASPAWVYGASGFAFALNIHEVICPSGPTAWPEEKCDRLAANIGAKIDGLSTYKANKDFAEEQEQIWRKTRQAIDAGMPCFGWELSIPEWYVINGYDADEHYIFNDFGKHGKTHYKKLGETGIGVACILAVKPGKAADDRTTVRESLVFALEHGAGKHSHDKWHTGLAGYDTWIKALENNSLIENDEGIGFGQAYNSQCWAECRRHAVAFLEEARKRLDDERLTPCFDEAIKHYKIVSENLEAVAKTFPFQAQDKDGMNQHIKDASRREKAVKAIKVARESEQAGLKALAKIAIALGAKGINPNQIGGSTQM